MLPLKAAPDPCAKSPTPSTPTTPTLKLHEAVTASPAITISPSVPHATPPTPSATPQSHSGGKTVMTPEAIAAEASDVWVPLTPAGLAPPSLVRRKSSVVWVLGLTENIDRYYTIGTNLKATSNLDCFLTCFLLQASAWVSPASTVRLVWRWINSQKSPTLSKSSQNQSQHFWTSFMAAFGSLITSLALQQIFYRDVCLVSTRNRHHEEVEASKHHRLSRCVRGPGQFVHRDGSAIPSLLPASSVTRVPEGHACLRPQIYAEVEICSLVSRRPRTLSAMLRPAFGSSFLAFDTCIRCPSPIAISNRTTFCMRQTAPTLPSKS
jgi:hypothetical protein